MRFWLLSLVVLSLPAALSALTLKGAGASFPYPLYSKWVAEYKKAHPETLIDYQSTGSGAGISKFIEKTVDFAGTDAPMTDEQITKAGGADKVLHVPTVLGAVVLTYNLPGVDGLKLSSDIVADIFLGKITQWNDARIRKLNPVAKLPDANILVFRRADGSGTTAIFTDYLAKVSPEWKSKVGQGTSVEWPVGVGGKGNEGVASNVSQTPFGIGYVELIYAENQKLPVAFLQNASGKFVQPSIEAVTEAAAGSLKTIPADFRVSITNAKGAKAYPISGFTYLLVPTESSEAAKGAAIISFVQWALTEGQAFAAPMKYAPLPEALVKKVQGTVSKLNVKKNG